MFPLVKGLKSFTKVLCAALAPSPSTTVVQFAFCTFGL